MADMADMADMAVAVNDWFAGEVFVASDPSGRSQARGELGMVDRTNTFDYPHNESCISWWSWTVNSWLGS
jgi:hypothetical protein